MKTIKERCEIAVACLPESPYRESLKKLFCEMSGEIDALRATVDALENQAKQRHPPKKADIKRLNAMVKSWVAEEKALCSLYGDARPRGRRASAKLDCAALSRVLKLL